MNQIQVDIPDGESNEWKVETFHVSDEDAEAFNMTQLFQGTYSRTILPGTYKRLTRNNVTIMSNTRAEINDHIHFIRKAKKGGDILINGLGLGVALKEILESKKVKSITVIEKSKDVIKLIKPSFSHDQRVTIHWADAFEWKPPKGKKYDVVWHDIWDELCSDNLPEMVKLHRKYGHKTKWQGSWSKEIIKELERIGY